MISLLLKDFASNRAVADAISSPLERGVIRGVVREPSRTWETARAQADGHTAWTSVPRLRMNLSRPQLGVKIIF